MTSLNGRIPLLNTTNYGTWKPQMEAILHKARLLPFVYGQIRRPTVVEIPHDATEEQRRVHQKSVHDQRSFDDLEMDARSEIMISIEPNIVRMVKNFKTAREIWNYLQETYDRQSTRRKAENFRKLLSLKMESVETITEYLIKFDIYVSCLSEMDVKLDESLLVVILLDGLTDQYKEIRAAFDTSNEFPSLNILKSRLNEIGDKSERVEENQNALKVKKWKPRFKYNEKDPGMSENKFPYKCYKCGRKGHKAKDCRARVEHNQVAKEIGVEEDSAQGCFEFEAYNIRDDKFDVWCIDSGATSHMSYDDSLFIEIDYECKGIVKLADNKEINVEGIGTVELNLILNNRKTYFKLYKTLYIPDLKSHLISTTKLTNEGFCILMKGQVAQIMKNRFIYVEAKKENNLYLVKSERKNNSVCRKSEELKSNLELWHMRLGHLNSGDLQFLKRNEMVHGLPKLTGDKLECPTCIKAKQTKEPFPKKCNKSTTEVLDMIHTDLCGPMRVESARKKLYFATFIDDYSRKVWVYFIRNKNEYLDVFKEFKNKVELASGRKIKCLRSDNAGELVGKEFSKYLNDCGIQRQLTIEYTPQQNGVAERMNRTLVEMVRCFIVESDLPEFLWAELVRKAAYVRNRCPTNLNKEKTPEELWSGKVPTVRHFRKIGCKAFALNNKLGKSKFEPRSSEYVLIGYDEISKGYILWKKGTTKVIKSRDVKFIEDFKCERNHDKKTEEKFYEFSNEDKMNTISFQNLYDNQVDLEEQEEIEEFFDSSDQLEILNEEEVEPRSEKVNKENKKPKKKAEKAERRKQQLKDSIEIENPIKQRLRSWNKEVAKTTVVTNITDPRTYKEALSLSDSEEWIAAMKQEYDSLIKNKTWDLVDLPDNRKAIDCKWVYKTKLNPDGTIEKRKARLVAKGYSQEYGVDYMDTYAPVVRQSSIRLVYALAVQNNLKLCQLDVSTAFLNGNLEEEIYMREPEGFEKSQNKVCRLKKAIYGLKQAARQWFKRIDAVFKMFGLTQSKHDQCIYFKNMNGAITIVTLYVDDILIASNNEQDISKLIGDLKNNFEIKVLGIPKHCIGLEVEVETNMIAISQPGYTENLIRKYGQENSKPTKIPMLPKQSLEKNPKIPGEAENINKTKYQEIIGSLLHLSVFSRPDIACSVNMLSQFCQDPRRQHWNAAIQVVRYLNSTKKYKLIYSKQNIPLVGYVDANWATDINDRKSQTGFCFFLAGGVISWESRKQRVVATSSAESEYIALSEAAKEAYYLRYLLKELCYQNDDPTVIYSDSQSAQQMAKFGGHHSRTKHIDYKYHFIRQAVEEKAIDIHYKPTSDMIADVLTKPLPNIKHNFCISSMGIQEPI